MMSADTLLTHLEGVKRTGQGRWVAKCPAHADKSPSLSIRELDDGRVLLHDFAGCSVDEIVGAVGMELSDLYPPREIQYAKAERRPFTADDALRCLSFEAMLLVIVSNDFKNGKELSDEDHARLVVAAGRIAEAERLCHGK